MASSIPPVRGASFTFDISLVDQSNTDVFKTSVTLAAGDIKVSKDGGAFSNITDLPTEIGTSGVLPVALSATEMTADKITVLFHDAAGDQWQDALVTIYTAAQTLDTTDTAVDSKASQSSVDTVDDFLDTEIAAIKAKTDNLPASPAAVGSAMTLANDAVTAAALAADAVTEIQAGLATAAAVAALNDLSAAEVNAEVVDVLRTDTLPDSYAADGAQPTIAQAVLAILQFLTEKGVVGTTVTVNKPDGTSAAMTFTLDDASAPTSITRAS